MPPPRIAISLASGLGDGRTRGSECREETEVEVEKEITWPLF